LTDAFSKKFENHCHALALYLFFYNFWRVQKTLGTAPAVAAGVVDRILEMEDCFSVIAFTSPAAGERPVPVRLSARTR
jgi:hypothetical protein